MKTCVIFASLLGLVQAASAQTGPGTPISLDQGSTAPTETVATAEDDALRMTVPVMVNGKGPFHFIIDTGADRSVISWELATQLNLPDAKKARLVSMGGTRDVSLVKISSLQVSPKREMKNIEVPALLRRNLGADGLLGLDALKGQRILMDFVGQTMTIEPGNSRKVREEANGRDVIVVRAQSRLGQLVLVDADANGHEIWVIVATGGQNSVANSAFRSLMMRSGPVSEPRKVELISVVGERIPADYMIVGKMRIGGIAIGNAAVAIADAHPFKRFGMARRPAMMLGVDSLRSFKQVSIDFANKQVKFRLPDGAGTGAAN